MALQRNTKIGILLTAIIVVVCTSFYFYQVFFASNFRVGEKGAAFLYIPPGGGFSGVKDSLEKNRLVHDFLPFGFVARLTGYRDQVKPGAYAIEPNESNYSVLKRLRAGRQTPVRLTFTSYRTLDQLEARLDQRLAFSAGEFREALSESPVTARLGLDAANRISLFIPDTYEVYWTLSPGQLLEKMEKAYLRFWNEERKAKAAALGLAPSGVMNLASIIQNETNHYSEMPRIAGVYLNRLRINMPLQADPTVKFAVGDFELKRIRSAHYTVDSPYNTYRYAGLPPGPIAIPIPQAIDAVLTPEVHDYLFFCARPDGSGFHDFSRNFQEHVKLANAYRESLDKRNIR